MRFRCRSSTRSPHAKTIFTLPIAFRIELMDSPSLARGRGVVSHAFRTTPSVSTVTSSAAVCGGTTSRNSAHDPA